jgi:hypothetical protein
MKKPNDVVIVISPELDENNNFEGKYKITQSIIGPVTMDEEDAFSVMTIGMMMITLFSYYEEKGESFPKDFEDYLGTFLAARMGDDAFQKSNAVH